MSRERSRQSRAVAAVRCIDKHASGIPMSRREVRSLSKEQQSLAVSVASVMPGGTGSGDLGGYAARAVSSLDKPRIKSKNISKGRINSNLLDSGLVRQYPGKTPYFGVTLREHGLTVHPGLDEGIGRGGIKDGKPAKRGDVNGWTWGALARCVRRLQRMCLSAMPARMMAVTLTVREETDQFTSETWEKVKRSFMAWLRREGYRYVITQEIQRRGTPHFHLALWNETKKRLSKNEIIDAWLKFVSKNGLSAERIAQDVKLGRTNITWVRYIAKHFSRGIRHYQHGAVPGWARGGRCWFIHGIIERPAIRCEFEKSRVPVNNDVKFRSGKNLMYQFIRELFDDLFMQHEKQKAGVMVGLGSRYSALHDCMFKKSKRRLIELKDELLRLAGGGLVKEVNGVIQYPATTFWVTRTFRNKWAGILYSERSEEIGYEYA